MGFKRIAVIMAGGSGERFWPLSRLTRPKQLLNLASEDQSLLSQTVHRLQPMIELEDVLIATAPHLVGPSAEALPGLPPQNVGAEPHKRNTAGCLVWTAANLLASDENARETISMAVLAADHRIGPDENFRDTVDTALNVAEQLGGIVTIGIPPTRPETGYGYIEVAAQAESVGSSTVQIRPVKQFREKPDASTAQQFLDAGTFFWNSGTFFWTLDTFLSELERVAPDLYEATMEIAALIRAGDQKAAEDRFAALRSVSIDYALMEHANNVYVAKATFDWDDVGAWDSLDRSLPLNPSGNVERGDVLCLEGTGNIVVNEVEGITVALLGLDDLVVVVTGDAVLICPKDKAQEVRKAVDALRSAGRTTKI